MRGDKPHLEPSDNPWDWLGKGIYFWEADPIRGYEWASTHCKPVPAFNTVRGLYQEADPVFSGSMIRAKTHIQINVLTPEESIQGYFRVPESHYLKSDGPGS